MQVDDILIKLKKTIKVQIEKKNYEVALIAAKTLANIYYDYNQIYTDKELEGELLAVRNAILDKKLYDTDKKCIFFYDGFGIDLRGLAVVYARALASLNYQIIYACPNTSRGKVQHILSEFNVDRTQVIYIDKSSSYIERTKQIDSIFKEYVPEVAFFYTTPWDVEAAIAFSNNSSTVKFQLDLTDHAYWIGINAFDYIIDGREMGASIAHFERGIPQEKIIKLDCAPYINRDKCDTPLPFDIRHESYIFTGGSLYKTLGDRELLYYKTINNILEKFPTIKFLYAGSGDDNEIRKLVSKYPGRAFLINERSDFYEIIKHCVLYVNSYPMFGGLMMRYAALAGKIPITLKHNNDADGILINQENLGIEYKNFDEYTAEINKLLCDSNYRSQKESKLIGSVMTEEKFVSNLKLLIEKHRTEYCFCEIKKFDTMKFRNEYKKRFTNRCLYGDITKDFNISLARLFPREFLYGTLIRIKEKLFK